MGLAAPVVVGVDRWKEAIAWPSTQTSHFKTDPSGAQIGTLMWQRVEREKGFSLRRRRHAGFCRPTILSLPLIPSGAETQVFWALSLPFILSAEETLVFWTPQRLVPWLHRRTPS